MVKRSIIKVLFIVIVILIISNTNVFAAKTYHFKAFMAQAALTDETYEENAIQQAVEAMQKLEYNNYFGTGNWDITNSKQDFLDYIQLAGKNYGLVTFTHGTRTALNINSSESITTSDISGIWHLVLINSCSTFHNDSFARAFKTVGETHRAAIGFTGILYYDASYNFWRTFNDMAGSTNLQAIVNAAINNSGAPAVLYGDGTWNGYAWY